jgi:predicted metal-dependent phosphotriesterase family hydrolase
MTSPQKERDSAAGRVMTVTGQVPGEQLGPTSAHEHLYCDISVQSGREDNIITDVPLMVGELAYVRGAGGRTVVDVTPEGIGRNPAMLKAISEGSGVQVVSGIAFYTEETYPAWVRGSTETQLADYFVREIEEGRDGVCAGLIGELASHNLAKSVELGEEWPAPAAYRLTDAESQVFRAAAKAQRRTEVAITTHASLGRGGHAQLAMLERAGADPGRVAIGHCDAHWHADPDRDLDYYLPILERGAFCGFDLIGWEELAPDEVRAERIAALARLGYARQIVLGSDTCRRSQLHANGGRGLDFLWTSFVLRLVALGVPESDISAMLVEAPRRLLAGS